MYAINFDHTDGRILSVTTEEFLAPGMTLVEELPEGDVSDYRIVDGEYVYDPLPRVNPPEEVDVEAELAQLKEENASLREQSDMLLECLLEMSEIVYQ